MRRLSPGSSGSRSSDQVPIATRIKRKVGWPTAAVMRRTWRLRPSLMRSSIQESGISLRTRIGGSRGHGSVSSGRRRAWAGRVRPSLSKIP
jgi:hypothetical protein